MIAEAADRATPGPWDQMNGGDVFTPLGAKNAAGVNADESDGWMIASCSGAGAFVDGVLTNNSHEECKSNATFIAAANPAAVKELIRRLREAERDAKRYRHLEKSAHKRTAWDIYGEGCMWTIGVHSDNSALQFGSVIDAAIAAKGE